MWSRLLGDSLCSILFLINHPDLGMPGEHDRQLKY